MSYSYLKNVFPNFEEVSTKTSEILNTITNETKMPKEPLSKPFTDTSKNVINNIELPKTSLLENFGSETEINYAPLINNKNSDNLRFYNLPYIQQQYPQLNQHKTMIEGFEEKNNKNSLCDLECDLYIKHISECNKCRSIILKQFGIETDRIKNEEIMEVISYLIFGLFMLLLIDSLKNK